MKLFAPPEQDIKIIAHDFEVIVEKIRNGKAHELSEGDTLYLGAAPKAATSKDRRKQPFSDEVAKPRAFAFKNSYMTYVLNNYIIPGKNTYEPIIKENAEDSFEDYVVRKIDAYYDWSVTDLCDTFHIEYQKKPKSLEAMLAYRMLGIKGNHAEEFEKANVDEIFAVELRRTDIWKIWNVAKTVPEGTQISKISILAIDWKADETPESD